jgi:hypothetical protein
LREFAGLRQDCALLEHNHATLVMVFIGMTLRISVFA